MKRKACDVSQDITRFFMPEYGRSRRQIIGLRGRPPRSAAAFSLMSFGRTSVLNLKKGQFLAKNAVFFCKKIKNLSLHFSPLCLILVSEVVGSGGK
jgi:hypothetical protein